MYSKWQEFLAEFFGVAIMLFLGDGVVAMNSLFNLGGYTNITIAWGIAVLVGILVSNRISGAHLNPAVTLALVLTKRFPLAKMAHYVAGQMLGGFVGAALVYYFYRAKFAVVDPSFTHSAGIFTTFPAVPEFLPSLMAEFIATMVLLFGILAIVEHFAVEKAGWLAPFAIGGLIVGIGMSLGGMHGYAMNPARDLSPRIFIALMGFKNNGLTDGSGIWIAPVLGSLLGAPIGAWCYCLSLGKKATLFKTDPEAYEQ